MQMFALIGLHVKTFTEVSNLIKSKTKNSQINLSWFSNWISTDFCLYFQIF